MKIIKYIFEITDVMDSINAESMIEHLTDNPDTSFTKNLRNVVKLTKSNIKFDEMKTMASNYILQIKDELPSSSLLCSQVAMAMVNLADVGLRLVNKVTAEFPNSNFATKRYDSRTAPCNSQFSFFGKPPNCKPCGFCCPRPRDCNFPLIFMSCGVDTLSLKSLSGVLSV